MGQENAPPVPVVNASLLLSAFGYWPTFHDGEVHRALLDRGASDERPSVTLVIHAVDTDNTVDEKGYYRVRTSVLVALRFDDVRESDLRDLGSQNVLSSLLIVGVEERGVVINDALGEAGALGARPSGVVFILASVRGAHGAVGEAGGRAPWAPRGDHGAGAKARARAVCTLEAPGDVRSTAQRATGGLARRLSAHTLAINGCPQAMIAHENRRTSLPHGGAIALIRMRLAHRFDSSPAPSNGHYVSCSDSHRQNADGASTRMPRNGSRINRS